MFLSLLAGYAFDAIEPIALWLTVAVVGALLIAGLIIFFAKKDVFGKSVKYMLFSFVVYALLLGIIMLVLHLVKRTNQEYLDDNYVDRDIIGYVLVPLLIAFAITLVGAISLFCIQKFKPSASKIATIAVGALAGVAVIVAAATIGVYYFKHIAENDYYVSAETKFNQVVLYVSSAVLIVMMVAGAFLLGRNDKTKLDSHCIALAGITIAMSFVLSYIKLWEMPQGGSITLVSLLPVMVFAYVYGPKKGILVGVIYGIMQAMQDPYIIHPAQFLLDYPVAFAMVGFAGVFKNINALDKLPQVKFVLGAIVAGTLRFISHVLSGVYAFGAFALDKGYTNFWVYSLAYNSFVFVDIALVVVVGAIVFSSKSFVKQLNKYSEPEKKQINEEDTVSVSE